MIGIPQNFVFCDPFKKMLFYDMIENICLGSGGKISTDFHPSSSKNRNKTHPKIP
jgi:hypothetical protein